MGHQRSLPPTGRCDFGPYLLQPRCPHCGRSWVERVVCASSSNRLSGSWGAEGWLSFPVCGCQTARPPSSPLPSCPGSAGGCARHMVLCFNSLCSDREFALRDKLISLSCFFFSFALFFCLAVCFLTVAVLQTQVRCLLRITVCHPLWKWFSGCSYFNEK